MWKHLRDEDALLTNMACDYVINLQLKDLDRKGKFMKMPTFKEGAKKGEITRAFKKMHKGKSTNNKLLTSFVDQIA